MDNTKVEGKMEALSEHGEKERQLTMKTWGDSEINSTKAMEKAEISLAIQLRTGKKRGFRSISPMPRQSCLI